MTIYHKHHIIPRHMGGSDDPSNLIELTVEEHAEAHRKLFEQFQKEEDKIAWLSLSGQASKKEAMIMGAKLGRAKTDKILEERYGENWKSIHAKNASVKGVKKFRELYENDSKFREKIKLSQQKGVNEALTDSSREKRKTSFRKIKHQQGSNNSNYGKIWISNYESKTSKPHPKSDSIPEGWVKGRKLNW